MIEIGKGMEYTRTAEQIIEDMINGALANNMVTKGKGWDSFYVFESALPKGLEFDENNIARLELLNDNMICEVRKLKGKQKGFAHIRYHFNMTFEYQGDTIHVH